MSKNYIKVSVGDYVKLADDSIRQIVEVIEDEFRTMFVLDNNDFCSFSDIEEVIKNENIL